MSDSQLRESGFEPSIFLLEKVQPLEKKPKLPNLTASHRSNCVIATVSHEKKAKGIELSKQQLTSGYYIANESVLITILY